MDTQTAGSRFVDNDWSHIQIVGDDGQCSSLADWRSDAPDAPPTHYAWDESAHPRGNKDNPGQFSPKGSSGSSSKSDEPEPMSMPGDKPSAKKPKQWDGAINAENLSVSHGSPEFVAEYDIWDGNHKHQGLIQLEKGTYDVDPDDVDSEMFDVFRWVDVDPDTHEVYHAGEWTENEAKAFKDGKAHAKMMHQEPPEEDEQNTPDADDEPQRDRSWLRGIDYDEPKKTPKYADKITEDVVDELSTAEFDEVVYYTDNGYRTLNADMRKCPPEFTCLDDVMRQRVERIEKAIAMAAPLPKPAVVHRAIANLDAETVGSLLAAAQACEDGETPFALPSITSASFSEKATGNFAGHASDTVRFEILAKHGLPVESITATKDEHELLLSAHARYHVRDVDGNTIFLEQIHDGGAKAKTDYSADAEQDDDESAEEREERAALIAEILHGIFGDESGALFDEADDNARFDYCGDYDVVFYAWNPLAHPRDKAGRFVKKGTATAVADAHAGVKAALKGKKNAETLAQLSQHLSVLTTKQLHELKKEHGLQASGKTFAALRDKIADRLHRGRREEVEEVKPEVKSEPAAPKVARNESVAPTPEVKTDDKEPDAAALNADRGGRRPDMGGTDSGGASSTGVAGRRTPRIVTAREHLVKHADPALVPESLRKHLNETQVQGAAKALESMGKHGGFLLSDGTGTGKTRQELAVAATHAAQGKKVIIVSPAEVLKPDWKKGTVSGSFANDSAAMGLSVKLNKGEELKAGEVHLTTYDQLSKMKGMVDKNTTIIFDESHSLKNWGSARAKHGYEMSKAAGQVMYATATPADKPLHIAHLFRAKVFGDKKWDDTYTELGMKQVDIHTGGGVYIKQWQVDPKVGYPEVYRRMSGLFDRMIEDGLMLKREISLDGLKVSSDRVELSPDVHAELDKVFEDKMKATDGNKAVALMATRMAQEIHKIPHVADTVQNELAEGRSVVVFAARVNKSGEEEGDEDSGTEGTMPLLRAALEKAGVATEHIAELHGAATKTPAQKAKAMEAFQSGKARVMLATIESGGTGINLDDTVGDKPRTTIMMTPPFSAVSQVQAAGRTVRLNTQSDSKMINVFANTTIDDWNAALVARKMKVHGAVVGGEASKLTGDDAAGMDEFEIGHGDHLSPYKWRPLVGERKQQAPSGATSSVGGVATRKVNTQRGERHVHSFSPSKTFWDLRRAGKLPSSVSVGKNPKTGDWEATIWGASPDEVQREHAALQKMGAIPGKVNYSVEWDESQHPRGKPGNPGQFTSKGQGGGGKKPKADKNPSGKGTTPNAEPKQPKAPKADKAKGDDAEPFEWDGTIDADEVEDVSQDSHIVNWNFVDGGDVYEQEVHLVSGVYDPTPDDPDGEVYDVYRWESHDDSGMTHEHGEWTTDKDEAIAAGEAYASENDSEPEWDGEIDQGEVSRQRGQNSVIQEFENDDGEECVVRVQEGRYDPFPHWSGSEVQTVYRWEALDGDGDVIDRGEWVQNEDDAIEQGEEYAAENTGGGIDPDDIEEPEDEAPPPLLSKKSKQGKSKAAVAINDKEANVELPKLFPQHADDPEATREALASIVGAPDDAEVIVTYAGKYKKLYTDDLPINATGVRVTIKHPKLDRVSRFIGVDADGKRFIKNEILEVKKEHQKGGLGLAIFAKQVDNAAEEGFGYISTHAAGAKGEKFNGYYTWPLFGYNESVKSIAKHNPKIAKKILAEFPDARSVRDLMATEEGAKWWSENGGDLYDAKFDLTEGSWSRFILDKYAERKAKQKEGGQ